MTSCKPPPTCIDASPIPDANDSRMSAIPYEANLTPMGLAPLRPPRTGRETLASSGSYTPASGRTPCCHRTLESQKALPQTPAPPIAGWPASSAGVSGPFPPPALPGFDGTTNPSAPAPRIGTRLLRGLPLGGLPWHRGDRFPRSAQEPLAGLTPSSCRSPLGQSAGFRRALSQANNWSLVLATSLRFRHVSNGSLTFV